MAEGICLSYASWLAEHRHVLWIENTASLPQVPEPVDEAVRVYPIAMFNQALAPLQRGRFYPARILNSNESLPGPLMRVVDLDGNEFTADFNHPLAGRECTFCSETCISHAAVSGEPAELLSWAGIDTPLADDEVDYADSGALARDDETADAGFYTTPRKLLHVDGVCAGRIAAFYAEHLTAAAKLASANGTIGDALRSCTRLDCSAGLSAISSAFMPSPLTSPAKPSSWERQPAIRSSTRSAAVKCSA